MSLLSKVTLVIFTFNRPEYVMRTILYWSKKNVNVLIMDGSNKPLDELYIKNFNQKTKYIYYPSSLCDRIEKSLDLFDTEFVLFHGDDEFFSPEAIESCIKELEKDKELVSCMGHCIMFEETNETLMARKHYSNLIGYKIYENSPIERMVKHMENYEQSTIYGITRTNVWKNAMKLVSNQKLSVFAIEEYIFEMAVAFMGKSKVIPVLYWFRSNENSSINDNTNRFNIWWKRKNNDEKYFFINYFTEGLSKLSNIDKKTIEFGVIKAGDAFTIWSNKLKIGFEPDLTPNIFKRLFYFIKFKINRVYTFFFIDNTLEINKKIKYPISELVNQLKFDGIMLNENEITEISNVVLNFHKRKTN